MNFYSTRKSRWTLKRSVSIEHVNPISNNKIDKVKKKNTKLKYNAKKIFKKSFYKRKEDEDEIKKI